ncbi:MAG: S4 domain-containing protein YaaA [Bacillales bacterium]|nr:S4 domain-containing protein YaaA [Bacillales bacterium]
MKEIKIYTEYITLGQFLKLADIIQSGGEAKEFLQYTQVYINGELDNRRGRKLRDGDKVIVLGYEFLIKNDN